MKLGAVSGTHNSLDYVEAAASRFESEGIDAVIYCSDIVAPFLAAPFGADFDFHVIRGNNDDEWALREAVKSFDTYRDDLVHLTLDGQEIMVYRDTEAGLVDALVDSGAYDFVLRGHSHERMVEHRGAAAYINPGGLSIPGADDTFHIAVVDLNAGNMASRPLWEQNRMGEKPYPNRAAPN